MKSVRALKEAAEGALVHLRSVPDVLEAEVFASSNGSLLCRLNYTSHIPCNGVEEPKSTESFGLGIQAVFRAADGRRVGFGSEPSDLTPSGVRAALEKARQGAVLDPEFVSLPRPSGEKRLLRRYHDPKLMRVADEDLVAAGWKVMEGALGAFRAAKALKLSRDRARALGLIVGGDVTMLQERMAIGSTHLPQVQTDESTLLMAFVTAMVEGRDAKGSDWATGTHLATFGAEAGVEAARNAVRSMGGRRVKSGEYTVIFGKQPVTDLCNNLILPSCMVSTFYAGNSAFLGKLGKPVAVPGLALYDHGALRGHMGSKGITCEGLPTGRTDLIRDGVLVGLLANHYEAQRIQRDPQAKEKLGADPAQWTAALEPRNGFRFGPGGGRHFDAQPGIAPTNVFVEAKDPVPLEELLRTVRNGLLVGRIWYTYPINGLRAGDFTCTVVGDSYLIKEGKIAAPLKPNTVRINDNIHRVLENIIGVSDEAKGTLVWAADEVVYAPEVAVRRVRIDEIAGYMDSL